MPIPLTSLPPWRIFYVKSKEERAKQSAELTKRKRDDRKARGLVQLRYWVHPKFRNDLDFFVVTEMNGEKG